VFVQSEEKNSKLLAFIFWMVVNPGAGKKHWLAGSISAVNLFGTSFRIYLFSNFLMRVDQWETVLYIL